MPKTKTIETHWCPECASHVTDCEHTPTDPSELGPFDGFEGIAQVADNVERGARAASTLARGIRSAVGDAAAIFGGRIGRRAK